jgi:hypothetical protein
MAHNTADKHDVAVRRGHEIFDLDMTYVRWFSVALVILLIFTATVAFRMLGGFRIAHPATGPAAPLAAAPPAPFATLQNKPQQDLHEYRREKAMSLEGYHWVDRAGGVVHIPIERAMELSAAQAQKGPAR